MSSLIPVLSTVSQSLQVPSQVNRPTELQNGEINTINQTNPNASTVVSLTESSPPTQLDYLALNNQQMVRSNTAAEQPATNANQTTSNLTYASDLQTQANYNLLKTQTQQLDTPLQQANASANIASE